MLYVPNTHVPINLDRSSHSGFKVFIPVFNRPGWFRKVFKRKRSLRQFSKYIGWLISNEDFWKRNVRFVDYFKLKASWGQLGNDLVAPFQYLSLYSLSQGYVLGSGRSYATGLSQLGATNPNITWEVVNVYNAGFESMYFRNLMKLVL